MIAATSFVLAVSSGLMPAQDSPFRIPIVDLAGETGRQVVVDRVPGQYLGHPTTVLLEDGRTILIVYPEGHGRGPIVLRRSTDGGRTWSERLPVPDNWATSRETPTIHRVVDAAGKRRLILFSGLYPIRMAVSEDDGASWTPLEPIGDFGGIVAMASVERLRDGRYMALFHDDGRFLRGAGERSHFEVYKTLSTDGGLTWSQPDVIARHATAQLCEPGLIRSPDGAQIAVLLRENSRTHNSFIIFSDDEGETWSEPRELPPALTGDRHVAKYAPDGRLFITFRDMADGSATKGDWVGWVGVYDDLARGREGQYRVRIMDNTNAWDAAYPGLERLPDGTFVTTTYGHWIQDEQPFIVSVRFRLEELDARVPRPDAPASGPWNADSLGNHRAVLQVHDAAAAVRATMPWRRRDAAAPDRELIVTDADGARIANVTRIDIGREVGEIAFQPEAGPGTYYVYYLPYMSTGGPYPKVTYPAPSNTADPGWLAEHGLTAGGLEAGDWRALPAAAFEGIEAVDPLDSFEPMERIATRAETDALLAAHDAPYLVFPEDRAYPIRMRRDLPHRWIERGPGGAFRGRAAGGEWYAFQLGVLAVRDSLDDVRVDMTPLLRTDAPRAVIDLPVRCINQEGTDWTGRDFTRAVNVPRGVVQAIWCGVQVPAGAVPGEYRAEVTVAPAGLPPTRVPFSLGITADTITAAGDDEPWRHSRLRWLDSRLAIDDEVVRPYRAVQMHGDTVSVLGRDVVIGTAGFPAQIHSWFTPAVTEIGERARGILAAPIELRVRDDGGRPISWTTAPHGVTKRTPGTIAWQVRSRSNGLSIETDAAMEFDGVMEFRNTLKADRAVELADVVLRIPLAPDVARYILGMGKTGGSRPDSLDWAWNVENNQDGAWIGDVNAGLQFALRDENYSRPLNTNFYQLKPLMMPVSWANEGKGGCRLRAGADIYLVECFSGAHTLQPGDSLRFDFRLTVTPFRPLDARSQFETRYYHRYTPLDSIAAMGANTVNVHHATDINPWINYPFLRPAAMKAYVDSAHARDMKVKIYYTVRELSNRAPELFALRSLGDEILSRGPGGGPAWLQEHLGDDYIAGWYVERLRDAAVINSGVSRWHNYYVEGLDWLVRNVGIDGLYIDDVAFDRTVMKRVRKVLDRGRPGALIDLHSANQFNPRDGFANSANLYLEHFPYIDRLWFGEYFDYNAPPEYWLTEVSGIPFGLMGEMLQDGGNPWRGMLYGMTSRLPWAGDPRPLWQVWDEFGIADAGMLGYWVPDAPVQTGRTDVLATTYLRDDGALVAIGSWANEQVDLELWIDWDALGIERSRALVTAPAIEDFQPAREFTAGTAIPVEPGRGWLLWIREGRPAGAP